MLATTLSYSFTLFLTGKVLFGLITKFQLLAGASHLLCILFLVVIFYLTGFGKNKINNKKTQELKDLVIKTPLMLMSLLVTSFYTIIYFLIFLLLLASKYGIGDFLGEHGQTLIGDFFNCN